MAISPSRTNKCCVLTIYISQIEKELIEPFKPTLGLVACQVGGSEQTDERTLEGHITSSACKTILEGSILPLTQGKVPIGTCFEGKSDQICPHKTRATSKVCQNPKPF